jgi:hypothetical protein
VNTSWRIVESTPKHTGAKIAFKFTSASSGKETKKSLVMTLRMSTLTSSKCKTDCSQTAHNPK